MRHDLPSSCINVFQRFIYLKKWEETKDRGILPCLGHSPKRIKQWVLDYDKSIGTSSWLSVWRAGPKQSDHPASLPSWTQQEAREKAEQPGLEQSLWHGTLELQGLHFFKKIYFLSCANVEFHEKSEINGWTMSVLHIFPVECLKKQIRHLD